jgi:indolepyruvate ferredoxin oxidoreductase alpha subunit
VFAALKRLRCFVSGDIGCYTLGALPPLESMHSCVCMGASIGMAHGIGKVMEDTDDVKNRAVAILGDSTFFHSGITPLMDAIWNKGNGLTIILDNRTTGMTGGQENPGTGRTLGGDLTSEVDLPKLCEALGVKRVRVLEPYDIANVEEAIKEELAAKEASVIIAKAPCVLQYKVKHDPWGVDAELCTGCKRCLRVGCIALGLVGEGDDVKAEIDAVQCNGCGVCAQMCKFDAIKPTAAAAKA